MTIVELCVHMDCAGCESKIRKALEKLEGVDRVEIDMGRQKVTVTGHLEQKKVLKAVRRTGRRAVLWPFQYGAEAVAANQQHTFSHQYHQYHPALAGGAPSSSSYNYYKHGYDDSRIHYQMPPAYSGGGVMGDRTGAMFSDENPNACSLM